MKGKKFIEDFSGHETSGRALEDVVGCGVIYGQSSKREGDSLSRDTLSPSHSLLESLFVFSHIVQASLPLDLQRTKGDWTERETIEQRARIMTEIPRVPE